MSVQEIAKICNNLILGISMAAVAEGMALGVSWASTHKHWQVSLTPQAVVAGARMCNPWPHINENAPASRGYQDGFATQLMLKI